jgi:hypothetical protein
LALQKDAPLHRANDLAPLSLFQSWLDCTTNTSEYDFRKGQVAMGAGADWELAVQNFVMEWRAFAGFRSL